MIRIFTIYNLPIFNLGVVNEDHETILSLAVIIYL